MHVLEELAIELEQPYLVEHVHDSELDLMWEELEDAHGDHALRGNNPMLIDGMHSPKLNKVGDNGDEDVEVEHDAEALE